MVTNPDFYFFGVLDYIYVIGLPFGYFGHRVCIISHLLFGQK